MPSEISLYEQIRTNAVDTDRCHLFYDWFCSDGSLKRRATTLMKHVRDIALSPKFDINKTYVFFKNNCPMWVNSTYDDFRICDLETGDVLYTVQPAFPKDRNTKECQVHGRENGFEEPLYVGDVRGMKEWFMTGGE